VSTLNLVVDRNITGAEHLLADLGSLTLVDGRSLSREQLRSADVLLVRSVTRVDAALLDGTPVRFVGTATSGYEHIDRDWLARAGIGFSHAPGSNANAVVEYVLAALAHCEGHLDGLFAGGRVGIIGYGIIGRALGRRLEALGIDHCAFDPWLRERDCASLAPLETILGCPVISLHAALTDAQPWPSRHVLGASALRQIPPSSLLINAGRGELIDNTVLLQRLATGVAPTTVLDVWEHEPTPDQALLGHCALATPHIAGYSADGKWRGTVALRTALRRWLQLADEARETPTGRDAAVWSLPASNEPSVVLRSLIGRAYDVAADDTALRAAMTPVPAAARGAAFDRLRREYPTRWELAGRVVTGGSLTARTVAAALECQLAD